MNKLKLMAGLLLTVLLCSFAPAEWLWMENKEGGFKVLFPRQPKVVQENVETVAGTLLMNSLVHEVGKFKDDNVIYKLAFIDYPDTLISSEYKDAIIEQFFSNDIKNSIKGMQGAKVSDIKINYKEYPGRRLKISLAGGKSFMYMQLYLVKSRLYTQSVLCEKESDNNTAIEKFLKSFTLL